MRYTRALILSLITVASIGPTLAASASTTIVGHRATVEFAPENTIAAIEAAIEQGAQLLELDIRTTADGHLILMHDDTVDRTTNGKGAVAEMTLDAIKALDAGSWFAPEFAGEGVPTLAEALAAIKGRALPDLDLKDAQPKDVVAALRAAGLTEGLTVYSGNWRVLEAVRNDLPGVRIRPTVPPDAKGLERLIKHLDPPIVNIDWNAYSPELIERIHAAGKKAFLNTMQAEDEKAAVDEAIAVGADYIQSDVLAYLVAAVARHQTQAAKESPE